MPGNVVLSAELTGLPDDSIADGTQMTTVDRRSVDSQIGVVPRWLLDEVDRGLRRVLSL